MHFHNVQTDLPLTTEELCRYFVHYSGPKAYFGAKGRRLSKAAPASRKVLPAAAYRRHFRTYLPARSFPLALEEQGNTMRYRGRSIRREDYYMYLPAGQSVRHCYPLLGSELSRSHETGGRWVCRQGLRRMEFTQPGQWLEILSFHHETPTIRWLRIEATEDPDAEQLKDCRMIPNRLTRDGTLVGVSGYREKIYVPAVVNGRPAPRLELPAWNRSDYLREFVVEEGVRHIAVDFACESLRRIEIPDSATLAEPPNGILKTAWFAAQPDGPVYFHGYYCGTKGHAPRKTLRLQEGTIGVLAEAYGGDGLETVIFPASIAYIGAGAFSRNALLKEVILPENAADLRRAFEQHPVFRNAESLALTTTPPAKETEMTAQWLYELGRNGAAAKKLVPEGLEPVAPKLDYDPKKGWIAHYYYSAESDNEISFHLALRLPSGKVAEKEERNRYPSQLRRPGGWTKSRLPANFYWSEEYLQQCLTLIRRGTPTKKELDDLEAKWRRVQPDRLQSSIWFFREETCRSKYSDPVEETITGMEAYDREENNGIKETIQNLPAMLRRRRRKR